MNSISASSFEYKELWKLAGHSPALREKGIGVELFSDAMGYGDPGFLRELFPGVRLGMHCPARDIDLLAGDSTLEHRYTMDRMESVLRTCQELGSPYMVLHTNVTASPLTGEHDTLRKRGLERFGTLARMGERYGVKIWVENVGTRQRKTLLYGFEDFLDIFRQLPQVEALLDVGHANINGWDIPGLITRLGPRLKGVHMHDNFGGRDVHIRMGSGNIQFGPIREALRQLETPPEMIVEYLMPSCDSVEAQIADCEEMAGWFR